MALAKKLSSLSLLFLLVAPRYVFPHPGSLDSNGGHYDRKIGKYHCHRSSCVSRENRSPSLQNEAMTENGARKVVRVIDGDTLVLSPKEEVRLIGVDTPETKHPKKSVECFGQEAAKFTKRMVEGKNVRVERDEMNVARRHKDIYRRTLVYIYLEDGTSLNKEIIRKGYGYAETRFPFRYPGEFQGLERQARERGLGLWSACN
jgi:micrococcal nuclease